MSIEIRHGEANTINGDAGAVLKSFNDIFSADDQLAGRNINDTADFLYDAGKQIYSARKRTIKLVYCNTCHQAAAISDNFYQADIEGESLSCQRVIAIEGNIIFGYIGYRDHELLAGIVSHLKTLVKLWV